MKKKNHYKSLSFRNLFPAPFIGFIIGSSALVFLAPGGHDMWHFFAKPYTEVSTTVPWVYLLTGTLRFLPWPFSWLILNLFTLIVIRISMLAWKTRWWVAILSYPVFWNLWLGQIEAFPIAGAAIGWLVINKKLKPLWMVPAFMLMGIKVNVTGGLALYYLWCLYQDYDWRVIAQVILGGIGAGLVTLLFWSQWPIWWVTTLIRVVPDVNHPTTINSSIYPYGLVFIPLAFLPIKMSRLRRAQIIVAVTLLAGTYFIGYHNALSLAMSNSPIVLAISWLPLLPQVLLNDRSFGWLIPLGIIIFELVSLWKERRDEEKIRNDSIADGDTAT